MFCITGVCPPPSATTAPNLRLPILAPWRIYSTSCPPARISWLHNAQAVTGLHDGIQGLEQIDKVINVTQDTIGRNPRSNPGTYAGALGFGAGRFSFNIKGGRGEACMGYGSRKVEMHFLPDV